jgi:hypothetical protein
MVLRIAKGLLRLSVVALVLCIGGVAIVTWQMFLPAAVTETGSSCPHDGIMTRFAREMPFPLFFGRLFRSRSYWRSR